MKAMEQIEHHEHHEHPAHPDHPEHHLFAEETLAGHWQALGAWHDYLFSERNKGALKYVIIRLSIAGFLVHLGLIFLAQKLAHPPAVIAGVGDNYLTAISTPFSFILFYEVVTLIAALPQSNTRSIANQYEIISLIFIRDVFKDIAEASDMVTQHRLTAEAIPVFADMWAGFLMFLLVAVFQHVAHPGKAHSATFKHQQGRARFIAQKKVIAVGLGALFMSMAAYNLGLFATGIVQTLVTHQAATVHPTAFYNDLFTAMIFTDVLILILSLVVSSQYEHVFRNAAFVVSIILIRFALTEGYPYGAPVALLAMVFGIMTMVVFNYHMRVAENHGEG
jgi:hypothetical protein